MKWHTILSTSSRKRKKSNPILSTTSLLKTKFSMNDFSDTFNDAFYNELFFVDFGDLKNSRNEQIVALFLCFCFIVFISFQFR